MNVTPVILDSVSDVGRQLTRFGVDANDSKSEQWLQELLYRHPDLLPVDEFDDAFGPLIPIGRELHTDRGPIDNIFISTNGLITVVETKLWKNPEKHRSVVAQIIDYAKELATWDYDRLCREVRASSRRREETLNSSLEEKVCEHLKRDGVNLDEFQDSVITNLSEGKFLLLIVGDRISPNVALLTDAFQAGPALGYTVGLVEMRLYATHQGADWPLLVVPDVVGRTVEKAVIKVVYAREKPTVTEEVEGSEGEPDSQALNLDLFLKSIPKDLVSPYQEAMTKWQEMGGVLYFTDKMLWWKFELAGETQRPIRSYTNKVNVIGRTAFERWFDGRFSPAYDEYLKNLEKSPVTLNAARTDRMWIRHSDLNADDLRILLQAAIKLVEGIRTVEGEGK